MYVCYGWSLIFCNIKCVIVLMILSLFFWFDGDGGYDDND